MEEVPPCSASSATTSVPGRGCSMSPRRGFASWRLVGRLLAGAVVSNVSLLIFPLLSLLVLAAVASAPVPRLGLLGTVVSVTATWFVLIAVSHHGLFIQTIAVMHTAASAILAECVMAETRSYYLFEVRSRW